LPDGTPYPVEYKHGSRHKRADNTACDDLQLAAQALCLEEMFARPVLERALYYATSRRRRIVAVNPELRAKTELAVLMLVIVCTTLLPKPVKTDAACSGLPNSEKALGSECRNRYSNAKSTAPDLIHWSVAWSMKSSR